VRDAKGRPPVSSQEVPDVCRRLRSKGAGVVYGNAVGWDAGYVSTAVFWCLTTADSMGPDDGFVHPHVCVASRACFCRDSLADR